MFYIKLKDGRVVSGDRDSDDVELFQKLIESELGEDAADLFDNLIAESGNADDNILRSLKKCINLLQKEINSDTIDRDTLGNILSELKDIYIDLT